MAHARVTRNEWPIQQKDETVKTSTRRVALLGFYGGFVLLLLLIVTGLLAELAPTIATRIAYNSEAYLFAVVLGAWIQFALPRLGPTTRLKWAVGVGAIWGAVGVGLILSDLPSRIRTLNETALALAVLVPYVTLRRPLRRWPASVVLLLALLTAWAVVWSPDSWVIDQAETFGFIALTILTFDVFDRGLLRANAETKHGARAAWYGFMMLEPVIVSALGVEARMGDGATALILEYLGRIHESFVGVLLVALILHLTNRPSQIDI